MQPLTIKDQLEMASQNMDGTMFIVIVVILCIIILAIGLFVIDPRFSEERLTERYFVDENGKLHRIPQKYADGVYEEGDLAYAAKVDAEIAEMMSMAKAGASPDDSNDNAGRD